MATLHILKGPNAGTRLPLNVARFVIGRNPECHLMLLPAAVSKWHAQITCIQGTYFIEDLRSRNHTYVNEKKHSGPPAVALKNNDRIRICDFEAVFLAGAETKDDDGGMDSSKSSVEARLPHSSVLLETQPAEKLRGLLEISAALCKTLDLDELLPRVVDGLFQLFKKADRAFLLLCDDDGVARARVVKTRQPGDDATARFSRTIVRQCLKEAEGILSEDVSTDTRYDSEHSVAESHMRSVVCAPLVNGEGNAFGVLQLDTQVSPKKFDRADLDLLCGVANQAAVAIENARLHTAAIAQEKLLMQLELAKVVQLSFLPEVLPEISSYDFHAFFRPANAVGGDYYDFIPLAGGGLLMTVGDVAGKGVPAALLMAKLSGAVLYSFLNEPDLGRAVGRLNELLVTQCRRIDRFVTLAACILDPAIHVVTMACAGHPSPLLYREADGSLVECLPPRTGGPLLGINEGACYQVWQVTLQPGDAVVLYSDGVPDAADSNGRRFTQSRFLTALKEAKSGSPRVLIESALQALAKHTGTASQYDDITMAALGRKLDAAGLVQAKLPASPRY